MRRTFNFTGRKDLPAKSVRISIRRAKPRFVDLHWNVDEIDVPDDGQVFLEAFSSGSPHVLRFAWGTLAHPVPPAQSERSLDGIIGDAVTFNFKVVESGENRGRLLASASNLRASNEDDSGGRQSLLPVNALDMGEEVWRISFAHGRPWLEVNNRILPIKEIARSDQRFFALVYPAAIHRVLSHILIAEEFSDPDGSDEWQCLWLRWGRHWHPDNEDPPAGGREELDDKLQWIDQVVASFSRRHQTAEMIINTLQPT